MARTRIRGRASSASWDIAIPVFSGPAGAREANRRVRAAADDLIAQVRREARRDGGVKRTLTGTGTVSTNDGRTVQVTITYLDFLAGTARPASYVTTTVVDVRRARPVLLTQVIQNPADGLRFLGTEVTRVARKKGDQVDAEGLAPRVANFANWQSSPAGLTFHFPEYQLGGAGLRSYTVPWSRARLVLSAYGERLLTYARVVQSLVEPGVNGVLTTRLGGGGDDQDEVAALDLLHRADGQPLHDPGDRGGDRGLHLHRLDGGHGGPAPRPRRPRPTVTVTTPANGAAT